MQYSNYASKLKVKDVVLGHEIKSDVVWNVLLKK